jgi:hypothetical protein
MSIFRMEQLTRFRDELKDARYSGVRRFVDQNGETVEYKSDSEMARAIAALDSEIAAAARPPSTIIFRTSKGL